MAIATAPPPGAVWEEELVPPRLNGLLCELDAVLGQVAALDVAELSADDQLLWTAVFETQANRVDALRVKTAEAVDRTQANWADGHRSAKSALQHLARLSGGEARSRAQVARALRDLPVWAEAYERGEVGTCFVRRIARVHANVRVRDLLIDTQAKHLERAQSLSFKRFHRRLVAWEQLADEDGTIDLSQRHHDNRDVTLHQDYDTSWALGGGFGAWQGANLADIFNHFVDAEREIDWHRAKEQFGRDAIYDQLPRTEAQRRADALERIFEQAAGSLPESERRKLVANIVIDHETYERELLRFGGVELEPQDPFRGTYRCTTSTGHGLTSHEAVHSSLSFDFRRIIVDATGSVTDVSHLSRGFRGLIRHGVLLQNDECFWPGCHVAAHRCQADHNYEHGCGGKTELGNGGPGCDIHNRHKTPEYHVWRTPDGEWHVARPDGKQI